MIRRAGKKDEQTLLSIFNDNSVAPYIGDDLTGKIDEIDVDGHLFLICGEVGFFLLVPRNSTTYEVHVAFLPQFRGMKVNEYIHEMFQWLKKNTLCRKIVAEIPSCNYRAKAAAIKNGFQFHGVNTKSFLKNGELIDQLIYGKEL